MPKAIIDRINADTVRHLKTEDMKTRFQSGGAEPASSTPDGFRKIQQEEFRRVERIVKEIGIKPQ
jgi:tripartite-type tricarboxylate transporter receptor subunit TctC